MVSVFWDSKGIIYVDFFTGQETINTNHPQTKGAK
jgi:hypothetical protein